MIYVIIALLLLPYLTYVHFAAVMRLLEVRDAGKLDKVHTVLGKATLWVGYVLDFMFNVIVGTILFLPDFPQELLFTARLKRVRAGGYPWQRKMASWFCDELSILDPSGCHCKE